MDYMKLNVYIDEFKLKQSDYEIKNVIQQTTARCLFPKYFYQVKFVYCHN